MINDLYYILDHPLVSKYFNPLIKISKWWKKYPTLYVRFSLGKQRFRIKEVTRDIANN